MNISKLLELCLLTQYPQAVTEETSNKYEEALQLGYVCIDRPKRARSDKFFLTESGLEAVKPVMYRYIYDTLYMYRDNNFTVNQLEEYHKAYPDMDGYELMVKYYVDRINEYDGNRTQRPPRTYVYFIAELQRLKGNMLDYLRYNLLICILDASGIMEVPTQEHIKGIEYIYEPGEVMYRTIEQLRERCQLANGTVSSIMECMEKLGYSIDQVKELYTDTYNSLQLPVSIRTEEEIFQLILEKITEINQDKQR